jgi:nucleoid-associated protein YgaU
VAAPAPPPEPAVVAAQPQPKSGVAAQPTPVAVAPRAPVPPPVAAPAPPQRQVVAVAESHSTGSVVVRSGDTLWSIAERHLGEDASSTRVAREVGRLVALNTASLADPDLIFPGQRLKT